ncbi:MAG: heme exporter protein CcmB, partial [Bacteroidota bacterium]
KTIYNFFLTFLMALFSYILYSVFIKNLVQDNSFFFLALLLGSLGFSSILTMVSAIASKASSNFSLMAILSFPLLIPFLIVLIKFSKNAVDGLDRSISYPLITVLILLFFVVNLLSLVLFPYLWKE